MALVFYAGECRLNFVTSQLRYFILGKVSEVRHTV